MWWCDDCVLAVATSDEVDEARGVYREGVVKFSLTVDREKNSVQVSRR